MNRSEPLVSVLMTSYNRQKYIGEAIESVLASTYTNFELIIVDDCSKDSTVEIAKRYVEIDKRVKIYLNENNLGDYNNRNKASTYAKGKYIKYLDSDDMIYPHGLEVFVRCMESDPTIALGICSCSIQYDNAYPIKVESKDAVRTYFYKNQFLNMSPSGCIIRKNIFDEVGGFSGKRMIGDLELWLKISFEYPVLIVPPSLIYWRQHEEQEFVIGQKEHLYLELFQGMLIEVINSPKCNLNCYEKIEIVNFYKMQSARAILSLFIKNRKFNRSLEIYKKLDIDYKDLLKSIFNFKRKINSKKII